MSIRDHLIFLLVLIGLPILVLGQNPPAQSTDNGAGTTRSVPAGALSGIVGVDTQPEAESNEDLPQIPAMLGGRGSSLAFPSEMERSNYLRAGINVGAGYDDNALLGSGSQVGNTTFSVFPNIALDESTSRMRWSLGYGGGLTVNQRLSNRNQGAHNLNFDSEFRLSPHVNLRAAEDFSLVAGIFGANAGFQSGQGGGNGTLITPLANQRSSSTVVEANYHFALKDVIGASGSFYDLHYSDVSTGPENLTDTRTAAGSAFWLHRLFHGDWAGISYGFQRITFNPGGKTLVHTFRVMNTLSISKRFTLSAFVGPEYSDNHGVAATGPDAGQFTHFTDWSIAGGVEGGWQTARTSVTAGYAKRVSDGGGYLGAVQLQNVHGAVRRELSPGWSATFGAAYGNNQSVTLTTSTGPTSIKSTSVSASLDRDIGRSLGLHLGYFHDFQSQSGSTDASQNFDAHRNRFSVTLSYQWAKPLGR